MPLPRSPPTLRTCRSSAGWLPCAVRRLPRMRSRLGPMPVELRPPESLFHIDGGWFRANWHFSFDTYYDAANTSFGDLRVFNDDRLIPGAIWPMHPRRDIE